MTFSPTLSSRFSPLVKDYLEVFSDEIPRILPMREIDFGIDLIPNTNIIFIPPYWIAPAGLKEIILQLKDLLDMGFIQPSM